MLAVKESTPPLTAKKTAENLMKILEDSRGTYINSQRPSTLSGMLVSAYIKNTVVMTREIVEHNTRSTLVLYLPLRKSSTDVDRVMFDLYIVFGRIVLI